MAGTHSAIEMAEMHPPRWAVHPMRVIFMISREPPPGLADRHRWSLAFHDFVSRSLVKVSERDHGARLACRTSSRVACLRETLVWETAACEPGGFSNARGGLVQSRNCLQCCAWAWMREEVGRLLGNVLPCEPLRMSIRCRGFVFAVWCMVLSEIATESA